jgi:hypothetical protein
MIALGNMRTRMGGATTCETLKTDINTFGAVKVCEAVNAFFVLDPLIRGKSTNLHLNGD